MLRHRFRDRGVETTVQRMEFFNGDRGPPLDRELSNSLANIAVVVDHLGYVETSLQQLRAMPRGGGADDRRGKWRVGQFQPKRLRKLRQEQGHAVLDLAG